MTASAPLAAPLRTTSSPAGSPLRRVAGWLVWTLVGAALLLMTLWSGAYFWLGSSAGRAQLTGLAAMPAGVSIGAVRWGPAWDEVVVGDIRVSDKGRELVRIDSASLDIGLGDVIGGDLVVDALEVDVAHLAATADEDGKVDLVAALSPPKEPSVASGPSTAKARPPVIIVKALRILVGEVWLDLGDLQAHVRNVGITGVIHPDGRAAAQMAVATGPCHGMWNKGRRSLGFDECRIATSVEGQRFEVTGLELRQAGADVIAMTGVVDMTGDKPQSHWQGWGSLGAFEANAVAPGSFPGGLDFDGLDLDVVGGHVKGTLGQVVAEQWAAGPFSADHVSFGVEHFTAEPGLLVPSMELTLAGLSAARLEGLGWGLEGVWFPRATGDLDKKLIAEMVGWSSAWTLPTGAVGPVALRLSAALKLTGGPLEADVESPLGVVHAVGNLKSSPLTKRTDFVANLEFADVQGPLADALLHDLADDQRKALGDRPRGSLELEVEVDRDDKFSPWVTTLEWALGRLDGKGCDAVVGPCVAFEWDGYGWGAPAMNAATPPEETP